MSGIAIRGGSIVGGEIGFLVGGPPGAVVGAIVGVVVVVGITALAVQKANEKADEKLKEGDSTEACADCGDGPECFEPPEGADPEEFARQLAEQEAELNKLSPDELLKRLAEGDARKLSTGGYRGAGDAAARQAAREAAYEEARVAAVKRLMKEGAPLAEIEERAAKEAAAALAGKDATHALDWIAGGDGAISGLGDSGVNRSIGSQWSKTGSGSQLSRREQLREAAKKAKARGDSKMNLDLKEC
jgi:hypothetical protein